MMTTKRRRSIVILLLLTYYCCAIRAPSSFVASFTVPVVFVQSFSSSATTRCQSMLSAGAAAAATDIINDCWDGSDMEQVEQKQKSVPHVEIVSKLPEPLSNNLKNTYYLLRHGQSTANVDEIISSDRFTLAYSNKHGLTSLGYEQGKKSAKQLLEEIGKEGLNDDNIVFVSSPFARARQTAVACLDGLEELLPSSIQGKNRPNVILNDLLIERYFGKLDGEAIYTYAYVWPLDRFNMTHTAFDVESVAAVCTRFRQLIVDELELAYKNKQIVLVSHADVLQIAQLYAAGHTNTGDFSSYRFTNGEVRKLIIANTSALPDPNPLQKPNRSTRVG